MSDETAPIDPWLLAKLVCPATRTPLRWDAARDARDAAEAQCRQTVLSANQRVLELQRERDEAATTAAAVERDRWIGELQAARDQLAALETQIGARKERVVCYPRAVARELNR
jgi:uncharacterized protein YbaR (Trm112 family)